MIIFPAIDLKDGQAVRLKQGIKDDVTVYTGDVAALAQRFQAAGANYLHVVDLDAAFNEGASANLTALKMICNATKAKVQVGGGIRTLEDIQKRLDVGVNRVILGSVLIQNPAFAAAAAAKFPGKIIAGIDAKNGKVAIKGWVEISEKTPIELAKNLLSNGITTCVYTDISKDGMMNGPNFEATKQLAQNSKLDIIASGGVSQLPDVIEFANDQLYGCIIGKALYEDKIDLKQALAAARAN